MFKKYFLFLLIPLSCLCCLQATAQGPAYWQQEVNYTIDVSLNDQDRTLDGFVRMQYTNHSPDTLSFIWIHLWPNAYKTDRTAFSDQLLDNGRTDFYFSDREKRGYINHLDFRVDGLAARMEDHPLYIDIIKVWLPKPLLPGAQIDMTTPFHEKLPFNFSRGGYTGKTFQLTQWYPKPAVYDRQGWHEMPYLDQGEFYSEFGNFDVRITLPGSYVVAAPGELQAVDAPGASQQPDPSGVSSIYAPTDSSLAPSASLPSASPSISRQKGSHAPSKASGASRSHITAKSSSAKPSSAKPSSAKSPPAKHPPAKPFFVKKRASAPAFTVSTPIPTKTIRYIQKNVHDFAWFANPRYHTDHDTLLLPSGRIIDIYAYYNPDAAAVWQNSIGYIKDAIRFRSTLIGEYPYASFTAAEASSGTPGGMEYPAIAAISPQTSGRSLDLIIEHEVGHNWFYAALATNERRYPWMDEGMNTFYDQRYEQWKYPSPGTSIITPSAPGTRTASTSGRNTSSSPGTGIITPSAPGTGIAPKKPHANNDWLLKKMPPAPNLLFQSNLAKTGRDQPISTSSEDFTATNYELVAYDKAAAWLRQLQDSIGIAGFDQCMQQYFQQWKFRHPSPDDFRAVIENTTHRNWSAQFALLDKQGPATPWQTPRKIRPTFLFNARNTDQISYINFAPAIGFNKYNGGMIGVIIHNYDLPANAFQFVLAPLYAAGSHQFAGIGRAGYSWYPTTGHFQKIEAALGAEKFADGEQTDSNTNKLYAGFYKITPSIRVTFKNRQPRSTWQAWLEWKTFLIGEKEPGDYVQKSTDSLSYPSAVGKYEFRYLNQLSARIADTRALYPYAATLQVQQADRFYRINFTGNYFFNYPAGGGMDIRLFGAKFGYLGGISSSVNLSRFQPKLTGVGGDEDYTYSNYFFGRNEYTGFSSQQIMTRDGGLKIRVPNFPFLEGRSDNWVSSLNLRTTLPPSILPAWLPLRAFFDIGTYSGAWKSDALTSHFLYTGGFQLSLFHDILHFYAPLVYSSDFGDQLKTLPDQNTFWKRLSFSMDIQNFDFRKFVGNIPL